MNEFSQPGAYEEVKSAYLGTEADKAAVDEFDKDYDEVAEKYGDEAARNLMFSLLKDASPAVYAEVMAGFKAKLKQEDPTAIKEIQEKAHRFQAETGPEQKRSTF